MDLQQTISDHWSSRVLFLPIGVTSKASVAEVVRTLCWIYNYILYIYLGFISLHCCTPLRFLVVVAILRNIFSERAGNAWLIETDAVGVL